MIRPREFENRKEPERIKINLRPLAVRRPSPSALFIV
jgi:hypothetical protein